MNKRLFVLTGFLVSALLGLLLLLIYWGNKSFELREALFVDRANIAVGEMVKGIENQYYCLDLEAEFAIDKMDSFFLYIPNNDLINGTNLNFTYSRSIGQNKSFDHFKVISPAHVHLLLRMEFDDVRKPKNDSAFSSFENYVREDYRNHIKDANGVRLLDTSRFDSLLLNCISPLYPEAKLAYTVGIKENQELIYSINLGDNLSLDNVDIMGSMFMNDPKVPELILKVKVLNKSEMFVSQRWSIYLSAALLILVSFFIIFNLIKIHLQQKKLLSTQKDFVHGMTHEFNTPISNIKLASHTLVKSDDEKIKKLGKVLEEEGNKLQTGINLLLTTALVEKDELLLEDVAFDLKASIRDVLSKNIQLLEKAEISATLDSSSGKFNINGDRFHIENVCQSLIANVINHSQASRLKIYIQRLQNNILIRFSDDGIGIEMNERKRIFEKFESRYRHGMKGGYGVGLYYSRMIVEMHGGSIELLSQEGDGSNFAITLPA